MLIGLKYCGGCNSNYERKSIAEWIRREYPGIRIVPYGRESFYDAVVVICGCKAECFTFDCENSASEPTWIRAPEEYGKLREKLCQLGVFPYLEDLPRA